MTDTNVYRDPLTKIVYEALNSLPKPKVTLNTTSLFTNASPDAPTMTHANGAKESHTELRFDLVPAEELATIAKILGEGAIKYGEDNWHGITTTSHINHAVQHLYAYLAGDRSDDHLGHAATRCMFAMWTDKNTKPE